MRKIISVFILLFSLSSCVDSNDKKIEFSSELNKVEFCSTNLDNANCSFYRPLFVKLYTKMENKTGRSLVNKISQSNAMSVYRYTSDYKKEINNIESIFNSNPSDFRFSAFKKYIKS